MESFEKEMMGINYIPMYFTSFTSGNTTRIRVTFLKVIRL